MPTILMKMMMMMLMLMMMKRGSGVADLLYS